MEQSVFVIRNLNKRKYFSAPTREGKTTTSFFTIFAA
jgi:hypothetical protein